jgi:glucosamine--fructose-6-phosphate aminotransferase (isomerizing)
MNNDRNMESADSIVLVEVEEIPKVTESLIYKYSEVKSIIREIFSELTPTNIFYVGCGSSYYAALKSIDPLIINLPMVKASALPGSEMLFLLDSSEFKHSIKQNNLLVLCLNSLLSSRTIGFTCVENSYLAKNSDHAIVFKDCFEKSYYMTKSFVVLALMGIMNSLAILEMFKLYRGMSIEDELREFIRIVEDVKSYKSRIRELAEATIDKELFVILAPRSLYPIALEAALKFTEISYTYSNTLYALEFRHGPIALLEKRHRIQLIILSTTNETSFSYISKLIDELKERGFNILHLSDSNNADFKLDLKRSSHILHVAFITPLYYMSIYRAVMLGYNPDHPKHIEKVVKAI